MVEGINWNAAAQSYPVLDSSSLFLSGQFHADIHESLTLACVWLYFLSIMN